jgi:heat shock protein HtpX
VVMTIVSFFASIASLILQFGFFFGGDDDENPGFLALVLVALGVYIVSFVLMNTLSRYREFAADRGAAEITRRPSALASALMKISGSMDRIPQRDLREHAHSELAAFYISPPSKRSFFALFSTHPPMEKRIAALAELERQLQGTAAIAPAA